MFFLSSSLIVSKDAPVNNEMNDLNDINQLATHRNQVSQTKWRGYIVYFLFFRQDFVGYFSREQITETLKEQSLCGVCHRQFVFWSHLGKYGFPSWGSFWDSFEMTSYFSYHIHLNISIFTCDQQKISTLGLLIWNGDLHSSDLEALFNVLTT